MTPLSLAAQTAYAQLLEALQTHEMSRGVGDAQGSFNSKLVAGKSYWYYQYRDLNGKLCQTYLGPESESLTALIQKRQTTKTDGTQIKALAQSAETLGCTAVSTPHHSIIRRLSDAGFFRAGGMLVGTHAFLCAGNMLGVRWGDTSRTQDLDFAHAGKSMQVALHSDATLDLGDVIESLGMGFVLDFLTPTDRTEKELVHVKAFNAEFQALRFMEFSLEDIQSAAIFTRTQACMVNVPNPARMAVHKLIVSGLRPIAQRTKANKDVLQAAALFAWYRANDEQALEHALEDAQSRGPAWRKALAAGLKSMEIYCAP
jgi:hypothetical protein